ncbi:MAG TPA: acyl-CoA dehydrogenase family protein [Alcaligenaceae bacterium]|nr:acyl-CoA dehydrogenase family protein [Alcaligenaceae bacterium]
MNTRLGVTAEDQEIAQAIARFAQEQLAPMAQKVDEEEISTVCHVPGLAELGVMGMNIPEQWGGPGISPTA